MTIKSGITFICPVCGKDVYRYPSEVAKGCTLTCSRKCRAVLQHKGELASCDVCSKPFYQRRSQLTQGYGNSCSRECHFSKRRTGVTVGCVMCGKEIYRTPRQNETTQAACCSKACLTARLRRFKLNRRNLFAKWQKVEWKADQCAKCGSTEHLELDHIIPRFAGGRAEIDNAQTLCRPCNRRKFWQEDLPYYDRLLAGLVS